jgi:O-acetyl-ADP-ribose deacetylase (regulator of RNase III)
VAFPAISAGVYGWPISDAGRAAVEGVLSIAPALESVREVRFVLFGTSTYDAFAAALAERD